MVFFFNRTTSSGTWTKELNILNRARRELLFLLTAWSGTWTDGLDLTEYCSTAKWLVPPFYLFIYILLFCLFFSLCFLIIIIFFVLVCRLLDVDEGRRTVDSIFVHLLSRYRPTNTMNDLFEVDGGYYTEKVVSVVVVKVVWLIFVDGTVVLTVGILWQTGGIIGLKLRVQVDIEVEVEIDS